MTFNEKYKDNALLIKTFNFALKIIDYTEELQERVTRKKEICDCQSIT